MPENNADNSREVFIGGLSVKAKLDLERRIDREFPRNRNNIKRILNKYSEEICDSIDFLICQWYRSHINRSEIEGFTKKENEIFDMGINHILDMVRKHIFQDRFKTDDPNPISEEEQLESEEVHRRDRQSERVPEEIPQDEEAFIHSHSYSNLSPEEANLLNRELDFARTMGHSEDELEHLNISIRRDILLARRRQNERRRAREAHRESIEILLNGFNGTTVVDGTALNTTDNNDPS